MMPGMQPRIAPLFALSCASLIAMLGALAAAGCSLVIDDPAPFPEPPSDAGPVDAGPEEPDIFREDAFVPRASAPALDPARG